MVSSSYNPFTSDVQRASDTIPVVLIGDKDGNAPEYMAGVMTADASADTVSLIGVSVAGASAAEVQVGDRLQFRSSGELPGGLDEGAVYYVSGADPVQVSTEPGGSAVNITNAGDGSHTFVRQGDEAAFLRPLRIVRTSGGRRLDYCDFEYDLAAAGERIENVETPTGWSRIVEVRLLDENGEPTVPLFWGEITEQSLNLGRSTNEERVVVRAELRPHHFGTPLTGFDVWDPISEAEVTVDRDPVFNPEVGGSIRPSMSPKVDHDSFPVRLHVEPQAARSASSTRYQLGQNADPESWTLAEAVRWVCDTCNPSETFVVNPAIDEDLLANAPSLQNIALRRGRYLPDYLDALLPPHGFGWYVEPEVDAFGEAKPTIKLYRLGVGTEKAFHWLPVGGQFAGTLTQDTLELGLRTNVGGTVTDVQCDGELEVREVTLELYRGWNEDDDADARSAIGDDEPTWKRWVANLGGDYTYDVGGIVRLRETTKPIPTTPPDLSGVFTRYVPRERPMGRPLTLGEDGERYRGVFLEYSTDDGSNWSEWTEGGYRVLRDEATIVFETAPRTLYNAGSNARLRVTCTLAGDLRVTGTASSSVAASLRTNSLFLDVADRFADRRKATGSFVKHNGSGVQTGFASQMAGTADERDDTAAIAAYAEAIVANEGDAAMDGGATLIGLVTGYVIGDLITGVDGRDISFNRNAPDAATERYLQVTGIAWDIESRTTQPIVEPTEAT